MQAERPQGIFMPFTVLPHGISFGTPIARDAIARHTLAGRRTAYHAVILQDARMLKRHTGQGFRTICCTAVVVERHTVRHIAHHAAICTLYCCTAYCTPQYMAYHTPYCSRYRTPYGTAYGTTCRTTYWTPVERHTEQQYAILYGRLQIIL